MKLSFVERVAQTVLRGWFSDPTGFRDMKEHGNAKASRALEKLMKELSEEDWKDLPRILYLRRVLESLINDCRIHSCALRDKRIQEVLDETQPLLPEMGSGNDVY